MLTSKLGIGVTFASVCAALLIPNEWAHAIDTEWAPLRDAKIIGISPLMRFNGAPLQVHEFVSRRPYRQVLEEWRSWLGDRRVENEVRGWRVLARIEDRSMTTVRLKADGSDFTRGTISEIPIAPHSPVTNRGADLAPPAGSEAGPHLEMEDSGSHSSLQTFTNDHSVQGNVTHLRSSLLRLGYRLEREFSRSQGVPRGRGLWFSSSGGEALLVAVEIPQAAGGVPRTAVSLHFVHRPTGGQ